MEIGKAVLIYISRRLRDEVLRKKAKKSKWLIDKPDDMVVGNNRL